MTDRRTVVQLCSRFVLVAIVRRWVGARFEIELRCNAIKDAQVLTQARRCVRVDIDKTRGDDKPASINYTIGFKALCRDVRYFPPFDSNVRNAIEVCLWVHDPTTLDDRIEYV